MVDVKAKALEARIRRKENELKKLEEELARHEVVQNKFGDVAVSAGTVLSWKRNFGRPEGATYTFAAIAVVRYGRIAWYLTGKQQQPLTWDELVEDHLAEADEEGYKVLVTRTFDQLN